jgi:lysophospholipase L1-like esterase
VKAKKAMVKLWLKTRWPLFKRNFDFNTAMLEELIKVAQARGLTPVLLELPNNKEIVGDALDKPKAMYRATVEEFAQKYHIDYVNFNDQLHIPNADFHDLSHLVEPGRVIWQKKLAEVLTQLMAKYQMGGTGQ